MGMWVGRGRKARAAYGFDDIALVPGALTVNPNEVDIGWELCGRRFDLPIIAAVPPGDARAVLEELDWGVIADPEPQAIAAGLERITDAPRPTRPADPEGRYERVAQARRLAGLLDEVVAEVATGPS